MASVLQQTLTYISQVSPLMQARMYSDLSATATCTSKDEVNQYIEHALAVLPSHVEDDPTYAYTYTSPYILYLNQHIAYSYLGMPKEAWKALELAEQFVNTHVVNTRYIESLMHQVTTAIELGNLDLTAGKMRVAIQASAVMDTELWYSDVENLYRQIQSKWRHETAVKDLGDMLSNP